MCAGDDFLAGIATFLEADAAEQVEVEHLRHEGFVGFGINLRQAGAKVRQFPIVFALGVLVRCEGSEQHHCIVAGQIEITHAAGFVMGAGLRQCEFRQRTARSKSNLQMRRGFDFHFRPEYVLAQASDGAVDHRGGQQQRDAVAAADHA